MPRFGGDFLFVDKGCKNVFIFTDPQVLHGVARASGRWRKIESGD